MGRLSRGTAAAPAAVQENDVLAAFGGTGFDGVSFSSPAARIQVRASEDWSPTARGGRLVFLVRPNGVLGGDRFAMVIADNESVGIGEFTPADRLDVNGDVRVGTSGTNGCLKNNNGNTIVGTCSSDLRFKRDITPFQASLDRVAALQPVHYHWRAGDFPEKQFGTEQAYGLIAQEVEAVLPEIVTTDADGYKAVDYAKLPLLAIQAIRELKERNEALERRLAALEQSLTREPRSREQD
jgi:hypothetical protein